MASHGIARALDGVRRALAPVGEDAVISAMEAFAEVFQVQLPEKLGLQLYVLALEDTPSAAFKLGCREVLRTHKYKTLPLPAEILAATQIFVSVTQLWEQRLTQAQRYLPPPGEKR